MSQFTYGADPEIFLRKDGAAASAYGVIPGTKSSPMKTSHGAIQRDGMAAEFNIDPTAQTDFEGFNLNIVKTIAAIRENAPGFNLNIAPVQDFGEEFLAGQPDEAKELGCDPDFNAYTLEANPRPDGEKPFRTGAGHVHIGWGADIPTENEEHRQICSGIVKMLDATVGLYMTYIDREPRRRELYGKAGAFRPKPYGVEYRTPSNVWIKNRHRRKMMHGLMNKAVKFMANGYSPMAVCGIGDEDDIVRCINDGDWKLAERCLDYMMPYGLQADWKKVKAEMAGENGDA